MFNKKFQQNISLLRHDSQIRLRSKKLDNNKKVLKTRLANFIQKEDTLNKDLKIKIKSWMQECKRNEVVTLINHSEQYICKKDTKINAKKFLKAKLDNDNILVLSKIVSLELQYFYKDIKLTKLFSPFSILDAYLKQNPNTNCLVAFIFDGFVYLLVTNIRGDYVDFSASSIVHIDEIDKSNFYEDDDSRQELFDEYYALKLREIITDSIKDFYKSKSGYFIEKIHIISDFKQVSDKDLDELSQELMLDIHFYTIDVDEYIYKLSVQNDGDERSFIKTKATKKSMFFRFFFAFLLALILVSASVYYVKFYLNNASLNKSQKITLKPKKNKKLNSNEKKIKHKKEVKAYSKNNEFILERIKREFSLIPDDMYLNFAVFSRLNSTLSVNLHTKAEYFRSLYPRFKKLYSSSNINFGRKQEQGLSAIIFNKNLTVLDKNRKVAKDIPYKIISYKQVAKELKKLLNEKSFVKLSIEEKGKISIATYRVDTILSGPNEFYELIEYIDSHSYALSLGYPIKFSKFEKKDLRLGFSLRLLQKR